RFALQRRRAGRTARLRRAARGRGRLARQRRLTAVAAPASMCRGHEGDDMRIPALLSALTVTLALGQGAQANDALTGGAHPDRARIRAEVQTKIRALRADLLRKRVGLDEVTALQVERVLNETNAPRRELRKKLHATMKQLRQ